MSGCESSEAHNTRDYCPHCSTCHLCLEEGSDRDSDRIKELEAAIKAHRDGFPDEALAGEKKLWSLIKESK